MKLDAYRRLREKRKDLDFPVWALLSPEDRNIVMRSDKQTLIVRRSAAILAGVRLPDVAGAYSGRVWMEDQFGL